MTQLIRDGGSKFLMKSCVLNALEIVIADFFKV